jgi:hypothetical protein
MPSTRVGITAKRRFTRGGRELTELEAHQGSIGSSSQKLAETGSLERGRNSVIEGDGRTLRVRIHGTRFEDARAV